MAASSVGRQLGEEVVSGVGLGRRCSAAAAWGGGGRLTARGGGGRRRPRSGKMLGSASSAAWRGGGRLAARGRWRGRRGVGVEAVGVGGGGRSVQRTRRRWRRGRGGEEARGPDLGLRAGGGAKWSAAQIREGGGEEGRRRVGEEGVLGEEDEVAVGGGEEEAVAWGEAAEAGDFGSLAASVKKTPGLGNFWATRPPYIHVHRERATLTARTG